MQQVQFLWDSVEQQISGIIDEINVLRKETDRKVLYFTIILGPILGGLACLFFKLPIGFCILGLIPVWIIFNEYYKSKHNAIYKALVMPKIVQTISPGATYDPKGSITKEMIKQADLYDVDWGEDFECEDTIRGKVGETEFVYSELTLSHQQHTGKTTTTIIDFQGFVFEADFNKYFGGITVLSTDHAHLMSRHAIFSKLKRCHLEDVNFDKLYTCYTSDDQQARYILTPALQHRIMEMNRTFIEQLHDRELSISFHDGRMLIMVPSETNRFEVKYETSQVMQDFLALTTMIDIVEMLNLNLRIWSKE